MDSNYSISKTRVTAQRFWGDFSAVFENWFFQLNDSEKEKYASENLILFMWQLIRLVGSQKP
jgi:hypothetical protein